MGFISIKNKLISIPLKYGFFGAVIFIVLFLIFYILDLDPLVKIKLIDVLLLGIFIFFALKEFRDRNNEGHLHFWQGMTGGMVSYLSLSILSALFIFIMTVIIDPGLTTKYIESRIALLMENQQTLVDQMDEETFVRAVEGVKKTSGLDLALDDFLKKSIIGLFLTIIIAVILRK